MTRALWIWAFFGLFLASEALAQEPPKPPPAKPPVQQQEEEPPEEDASIKPREYTFNPLQAQKELNVGSYYVRKGSFKAAANRFREATRWDPTLAEAWFRLGEAQEKLKDKKAAKESYAKYLEMSPDGKDAAAAKKKLGQK